MLKTAHFWGGLVLFSLLYAMLTGYGNNVVTVVAAATTGVLIALLLGLVPAPDDGPPHAVWSSVLATCAVVLGTLLKVAAGAETSAGWDSAAVALAAFSSWGFDALRSLRHSPACFRCKQSVGGQPFVCPRCGQTVCARPTCWSGRHLRCTSCLEREVVLLPTDDVWWNTQFGPRVRDGSCDVCFKEAHESDLRACGQCPLLMCRRCWDHHNGRCTRCAWTADGLPPAIRPYLARSGNRRPPGGTARQSAGTADRRRR